MGQRTDNHRSFLRSLASDASANTIAISAASMVPLMAMVGGGVDASRYYMADARMQAACDAGALAGRRAMADGEFASVPSGSPPGTQTPKVIAENFFDQNYEDGLFGTEGLSRTYTEVDGEVNGVATGTMPTSIMGAFGYDKFELSVECQADINISNTDIMFVLDVTGSMSRRPDGTSCAGGCGADSRLQGLRDAVMTFHSTVEGATSPNAQVRYGIMPYSTNVNVGEALHKQNTTWLARTHTYQSRETEFVEGDFEPVTYVEYVRTGNGYNFQEIDDFEDATTHPTFDDCVAHYNAMQVEDENPSGTRTPSWTEVSSTGSNPRTVVYSGTATFERVVGRGGTYYFSSGLCDVDFERQDYQAPAQITVIEEAEQVPQWVYRQVEHDLTGLYAGLGTQPTDPFNPSVDLPTGWNNTTENIVWDGCIEEASTVADASFDPIPTNAFDLQINLAPSNADERWKPVLRNAVWQRGDNADGFNDRTLNDVIQTDPGTAPATRIVRSPYSCPRRAMRLQEITAANLLTEVNALQAGGNTYHDIGMIWGARFISPNGIFAAANSTAPNGDAIARHIVYMTDGTLQPFAEHYTAYGMEWWDRRITGNADDTAAFDNHSERFQAACRAARQENISVWVVAFGTALTQNLIDCATPGRAFAAADSATLDQRFEEIAQQIAALRLTQ